MIDTYSTPYGPGSAGWPTTDNSHPSDTVSGPISGNPFDSPDDPIVNLIKSSKIYKQAYQIFSSDTRYGTPFLRDLEMIPYQFSIRDENFWDEFTEFFGGTSDYDNLVNDAFSQAMDEIRVLVQNYYTFINTLPIKQVEQLAEAGINASVTGEGVTPSSMASDPVAGLNENPSNSQYNNQALSSGITSFVEFINSMSNLGSVAVSSESILGMLDLAEREGYNKQETHDMMMSQLGITSSSPYRVLQPGFSNPVISSNAQKAVLDSKVAAARSAADAGALDSELAVNVGNDPKNVARYEIITGKDVLNEVSRFKLVNEFSNIYIDNLRNVPRQLYAQTLGYLEGEYNAANYGALMAEQGFKKDFFTARSGASEGRAQTSIMENLMSIREAENKLKQFEAWIAEYKMNTLDHWSTQIVDHPSIAPFFYKAMFDFDMSDTFYHMSPWTMGLKYGMENLESLSSIIGNIMGFAKPKKPKITKTSSTSSGPRGITETYTESITE